MSQPKCVFTTKMTSKGQVVIPEAVRISLGLLPGMHFVVVGRGDSIVLKLIDEPPMEEFKVLLSEAKKSAKKAGLKKADLEKATKIARKKK